MLSGGGRDVQAANVSQGDFPCERSSTSPEDNCKQGKRAKSMGVLLLLCTERVRFWCHWVLSLSNTVPTVVSTMPGTDLYCAGVLSVPRTNTVLAVWLYSLVGLSECWSSLSSLLMADATVLRVCALATISNPCSAALNCCTILSATVRTPLLTL